MSSVQTTVLVNAKYSLLCVSVVCIIIAILCIIMLIYYIETTEVRQYNKDGWVLYYSHTCPHCVTLKNNLPWLTWYAMVKYDCADPQVKCPNSVKTVPTWVNKYTGKTSDGFGVFR
jgi:Ca2+/Na+ antiporter